MDCFSYPVNWQVPLLSLFYLSSINEDEWKDLTLQHFLKDCLYNYIYELINSFYLVFTTLALKIFLFMYSKFYKTEKNIRHSFLGRMNSSSSKEISLKIIGAEWLKMIKWVVPEINSVYGNIHVGKSYSSCVLFQLNVFIFYCFGSNFKHSQ